MLACHQLRGIVAANRSDAQQHAGGLRAGAHLRRWSGVRRASQQRDGVGGRLAVARAVRRAVADDVHQHLARIDAGGGAPEHRGGGPRRGPQRLDRVVDEVLRGENLHRLRDRRGELLVVRHELEQRLYYEINISQ